FIIACNDVAALQTEALVARIHARLARPFALPGIQISVTATIGVACTSDHRVPPDRLIHDADLSMYRAKRTNEASHWLGKDGWLGRDGELVPNDDGDQPTAGDRGRSDSEGEREGPPD
nr:diguanylate cyclase [Actinomycetota bacterium]